MKQTAVEWLEENLIFEPWEEEHFKHNIKCWDKAKEMEIEQTKIYSIDKELFKRLPIEAVNYASCSVTHAQYFTTKMYLDKFKANYEAQEIN